MTAEEGREGREGRDAWVGALAHIFHRAMLGVAAHVDAFLGESCRNVHTLDLNNKYIIMYVCFLLTFLKRLWLKFWVCISMGSNQNTIGQLLSQTALPSNESVCVFIVFFFQKLYLKLLTINIILTGQNFFLNYLKIYVYFIILQEIVY